MVRSLAIIAVIIFANSSILADDIPVSNIPQDRNFLERVDKIFNEKGRVDPKYIVDLPGGLTAPAGSTFGVTFLGEGAGYKNTFS